MSRRNTVLFRLEAGPAIGMGHLVRCLSLARTFGKMFGARALFVTSGAGPWADRIAEEGFEHRMIEAAPWDENDAEATAQLIENHNARALVTDYFGIHPEYIARIKRTGAAVICIDDIGEIDNTADIIVNGSLVPSALDVAARAGGSRLLRGPDYMILDPAFAEVSAPRPNGNGTRELLVSMGGSDPNGLTSLVLGELNEVGADFRVQVVIGPAFEAHARLKEALEAASYGVEIYSDVRNMAERIARCDLAVTAGGITLYELSACGLPAIVISQQANQLAEAKEFERLGAAVNLGLWSDLSGGEVARAVAEILGRARNDSPETGRRIVDGRGAARVVEEMAGLWQ